MEPKEQLPRSPKSKEVEEKEKYKKEYDYFPTEMNPWDSEDMAWFLKIRKIEEEDKDKIKYLMAIIESDRKYKDLLFSRLHNAFMGGEEGKEDKLRDLRIRKSKVEYRENLPQNVEDFYDILTYFLERYGVMVTHHFERLMEDLPRKMEEEIAGKQRSKTKP